MSCDLIFVSAEPSGDDLSETPFFFTPEHSGNVMARYEKPLEGNAGTLNFTANAAYTGDTWINALHTSVVIDQQLAYHLRLRAPAITRWDGWP